ncbi:MAG: transporter, family, multidrug resistance protein [Chloroflexota bacterium]|nr:transporter, family, multidrug resistance protein [Chloroflexota bacterium]
MGQVFAFLPTYVGQMGVSGSDRLTFVGLFSSLIFVVGAPLVPLWGVWADKYSRKAIIIRSALVEAVVFCAVALSREPWQLALSLLLVGLQLGNTGVMLAALRDVAPRQRIGAAIGFFGSSTALGFALGPIVGGLLVDGLGFSLSTVFAVSAAASVGTALLISLTREVRPAVVPQGRVVKLAYGAVRGVLTDRIVRRLFLIYFVAFLANQMSRPFVPVLIEGIVGTGPGLASSIGLVTGVAALIGALSSPIGGMSGDRFGFRSVLVVGLGGGALALALQPWMPSLLLLGLAVLVFVAFNGTIGPMIFSLLATEVPDERRSATLNLVYLPLYAAGIVGPATGALTATVLGVPGPFILAAAILGLSALIVLLARRV